MLKRFFEVNFFFSNVLVPAIASGLYCGSFAYFSSHFLLEGVNYVFVSRLGKYLGVIVIGVLLNFLVMLKTKKGTRLTFKHLNEKFYPGDVLLLLLPLTPVVQYVLNNQEILSPVDSLFVLIIFLFFAGFYTFAIPALLGIFMSTRTLMILGLAFSFTIVSMALLSDHFAWFERGSLKTQLVVLGGVFSIVWLLYALNQRTVLYLFIVANFVVNSSVQLFVQGKSVDASSLPFEENKLLSLVGKRTPAITPNIYLLVYDSYVSNETMSFYGIDNSAQEDYLSEQGFNIYPRTYSIAPKTTETMSRVLNASAEVYGNLKKGVSGDGITQNILRDLGYKTYGLFYSDFMFRGYGESYDFSIPERSVPPFVYLLKAIFIGEFRFDIENVGFSEQTRDQFVEAKQKVLEDISLNPVFVYMHTDRPNHTQTSGACLPNEAALLEKRLAEANLEMRQDLDLIIANDPGAIVIVAGDHGPHLTKNCFETTGVYDISEISRIDIQDRYGTFLAIRWPTEDYVNYDEITILQDLFPSVFAYLYKDATILEAKIEPIIPIPNWISGASVNNGVIIGGIDDGEPLFVSGE